MNFKHLFGYFVVSALLVLFVVFSFDTEYGYLILLFALLSALFYLLSRLLMPSEESEEIAVQEKIWKVWETISYIILALLGTYAFVVGGVPEIKSRWNDLTHSTILLVTLIALPISIGIFILLLPLLWRITDSFLSAEKEISVPAKPPKTEVKYSEDEGYVRRAMRRVNVDLWQTSFMLTDIGLLVYQNSEDRNPTLIRNRAIPKKAHYLRPFISLRLWRDIKAQSTPVVLEICEEHSEVLYRYADNAVWDDSDRALILPITWLDISTAEKDLSDKNWSIRVYVDGKLLALHLVYWGKFDETDIEKETRRDGEISPKLRRLIEQERVSTNIGLDDLLADREA